MVQTACTLGILIEWRNGPAAGGQLHQPLQRRVRWQVTEIPLHLAVFAWHGALAEQPALRSRADAMMASGELCPARGPMHTHGHKLFAEDGARQPRAR